MVVGFYLHFSCLFLPDLTEATIVIIRSIPYSTVLNKRVVLAEQRACFIIKRGSKIYLDLPQS